MSLTFIPESVRNVSYRSPHLGNTGIEERGRPEDQQQHTDWRSEKGVRRHEHLAAGRNGDEPPGEQDVADRQRDAREPVQDRQGRRDLEVVPRREHERRQWTFHGYPFVCRKLNERNRRITSWSCSGGGLLPPVIQSNRSASAQSSKASNRSSWAPSRPAREASANEPSTRSISCVPRCQLRNRSRRLRMARWSLREPAQAPLGWLLMAAFPLHAPGSASCWR